MPIYTDYFRYFYYDYLRFNCLLSLEMTYKKIFYFEIRAKGISK